MTEFAINHMTVRTMSFARLIEMAADLGCTGIELRNDLPGPLFDGLAPAAAGRQARQEGLRIFALAEVKSFNDWSEGKRGEAEALMDIAAACGAEGVALIPRNDGLGCGETERREALRAALEGLKPLLESRDLLGMVEPLGFPQCSLRSKAEAVEAIADVGGEARFRLVHDTFHHALAGGGPIFPELTGIVHISGITDSGPVLEALSDAHRVLVGPGDRLDNIGQIAALASAGWNGALSFEAFAPEVHALQDPAAEIARSIEFIVSERSVTAA